MFPDESELIEICVGDEMKWRADNNSELIFAEICYLPYEDGRFKVL